MDFTRKIASLFLLVVLLITTTGFNMYTAFCQMTGERYSSTTEKSCCCKDSGSADQCCDHEARYIQLDVESSIPKVRANVEAHFLVAWVRYQIFQLFPGKNFYTSKYFNYSPPLIERDISIFVQSFLL